QELIHIKFLSSIMHEKTYGDRLITILVHCLSNLILQLTYILGRSHFILAGSAVILAGSLVNLAGSPVILACSPHNLAATAHFLARYSTNLAVEQVIFAAPLDSCPITRYSCRFTP